MRRIKKSSKYFFLGLCIAAGLLLLPVGCSKQNNTVAGGIKIPITLYESREDTKAIVSEEEIPSTYTIYTSAYMTNLTDRGNDGNYFVAKPFHKNDGLWSAIPAVYWPLGCILDFSFLACEDTAIDIDNAANWREDNATKGVEVDIPDGRCLDSEILFGVTLNRKSDNGSVPVMFKHSQSWLQFIINSEAADILRIDKIVVEDVYTGGTVRISNDVYLDAEWAFRGHRRNDSTVPGSEGAMPVSGSPAVCNILLPEQEACNISMYYSVRGSTVASWDTATSSVFHYTAKKELWYYGEKNIFEITFNFDEITMKASVQSWNDSSTDLNF